MDAAANRSNETSNLRFQTTFSQETVSSFRTALHVFRKPSSQLKQLRILFVCGAGTVYGKEIITLSLIQGLRNGGHEVWCLTTTWGDSDFLRLLEEKAIPYSRVPLGFISKTLSWPAILMTLDQVRRLPELWIGYRKAIKAFRPDIILHSNFHHIFLLWPVLGARINIFHVHDYFVPKAFYRWMFKLLAVRLTVFVGVSRFIAESLIEVGVKKNKTAYVLNGVSVAEPDRHEPGPVSSQRPGENEKDKSSRTIVIGIVGQVGQWKGHDDLVEALQILKRDDQTFICRVYGNGDPDYEKGLKEKIDRYSIANNVQWAGFVDRKTIYGNLDICVVPSRRQDPCPTVALEASHFGLPIIATRNGGLPEIVRDGETGYLVDAGAPEQLAQKLTLLIQNPDLRISMGQAARQHALLHFTCERMVDEMEVLLDSFMEPNQGKAHLQIAQ
jgi:glycosyltransferase involved in cell wall biosynthesis